MLDLLYAAPFFLLSVVVALTFFAFPRLRRYTLYAFVAPLAFGASAIIGMLAIMLFCDFVLHIKPASGGIFTNLWGWIIGIMVFIMPGICGTVIAMHVLNFLRSKLK